MVNIDIAMYERMIGGLFLHGFEKVIKPINMWYWHDGFWHEWSCIYTERFQKHVIFKNVYKRLIDCFEWLEIVYRVKPFETILRYLYVAGWEIVQNRSKPFHAIYKYLFVNSVKPFQSVLRYL